MGDYIEREKLIEHLRKDPLFELVERYGITGVIESIPAADVRPVKRGRWISHDFVDMGKGRYTGSVECSACGRFLPLKENFCPNCGADMRGDADGT